MQVQGLNPLGLFISNGKTGTSTLVEGNGFDQLFASILKSDAEQTVVSTSSNNEDLQIFMNIEQQSEPLSTKELHELLDLLNKDDVLELEDGIQLLDQVIFNSQPNLLNIIKEYFGLEEDVVERFFLNNSNVPSVIGTHALENRDVKKLEALTTHLNNVLNLQSEESQFVVTRQFSDVVKVVKLFELLVKNQDVAESKPDYKEFINTVTKKLELIINRQNIPQQNLEYLQKTFTPIVKELNINRSLNSEINKEFPQSSKPELLNGPISFQHQSRAEQLTLMLGTNSKPVSAEQLIKQFENILSKGQFTSQNGTQKLLIKLNPEHLGSLRIEISQKDSVIMAKILTSTVSAKDMMETQLTSLRQAFINQNIQVDRIEVSQQMTQQERFLNKDGSGQQDQQSKQQHNPHKEEEQDNLNFNLSFEEALLNTKV